MSQVIVVASGKGGTGKTTVSVSLALALVRKNNKVLCIDCDSGMRGTDMMLNVGDKLVYDVSDIICGACDKTQAMYECPNADGLYTVAAPMYAEDEVSPQLLKQFVDSVKNDFDYVIVDSPAGVGTGFEAAAISADRALVVVNPEPISVRGAQNIKAKLVDMGIGDIRLVINRFDRDRFETMGIYEDLDSIIDITGIQLIAVVPEDVRITALAQRGALAANWSKSAMVFDALTQRIGGNNIPLVIKI